MVRKALILALMVAVALPMAPTPPAQATTTNPTLNFYISPPAVMNTLVADAKVATFDNEKVGPCPTEWFTDRTDPQDASTAVKIGTITGTGCKILQANKYGGAVPNADDKPYKPTSTDTNKPDAGTNFVSISANTQTTLTLAQPESYLGFWWSAGDRNNKITLYSGGTNGTRVGIFQTSSLTNLLKGTEVTTITSQTFKSCLYYGNPRYVDRTTKCAADTGGVPNFPNEPFAYIHLVGEGGLTFDTIVFSQVGGAGFELDNVAIQRGFVVKPQTDNIAIFPPEINATTPNLTGTTCDSFPSSFGLIASNFAQTPTYSINPTTLPEGLVFNTSTGGVSGTPTAAFTKRTFTITATAGNQTATADVELEVTDPGNTPCPPPPPPPINPSNSSSSSNNPHTHTDGPAANSPQLAATGAPAWPLWAAMTVVAGVATIAASTLIRRRHS